jgi:hypothetical protein
MTILLVGDGSNAGDLVTLSVGTGQTVVVAVNALSANSLQVFQAGVDQPGTQVNAGGNLSISVAGPVWLQASSGGGPASVQVTGGPYAV